MQFLCITPIEGSRYLGFYGNVMGNLIEKCTEFYRSDLPLVMLELLFLLTRRKRNAGRFCKEENSKTIFCKNELKICMLLCLNTKKSLDESIHFFL